MSCRRRRKRISVKCKSCLPPQCMRACGQNRDARAPISISVRHTQLHAPRYLNESPSRRLRRHSARSSQPTLGNGGEAQQGGQRAANTHTITLLLVDQQIASRKWVETHSEAHAGKTSVCHPPANKNHIRNTRPLALSSKGQRHISAWM